MSDDLQAMEACSGGRTTPDVTHLPILVHDGERRHSHDDSHVHFQEDQFPMHESEIAVRYSDKQNIDVLLGFLQVNHRYDVVFSIEDTLHDSIDVERTQHGHVHVKEIRFNGKGHDITVDFHATKEKLVRETIKLFKTSHPEYIVKIVLHARVLGAGKGTPLLKSGIRCTGVLAEDEAEHSDWQGFD